MRTLTYHLEDDYIRLDDLLKLNGCCFPCIWEGRQDLFRGR